jgi:hypothetical protein
MEFHYTTKSHVNQNPWRAPPAGRKTRTEQRRAGDARHGRIFLRMWNFVRASALIEV